MNLYMPIPSPWVYIENMIPTTTIRCAKHSLPISTPSQLSDDLTTAVIPASSVI